jgi:hypothetical protein
VTVGVTCVLAGCATGGYDGIDESPPATRPDSPPPGEKVDSASGADSSSDAAPIDTFVPGEDAAPDSGGGDEVESVDTAPDTELPDTGAPDTATPDTGVGVDTSPPDTLLPIDGGCPPPTTLDPAAGKSCATPIPISLDVTCKQTFTGDSCAGSTLSTSCGSGQGLVYSLSISSGIRLYAITVSSGFSLATIPGLPFCGGAGGCVGLGMSTGVSAGSTQWWTVMKSGGGCGTYTITVTPS